MAASMPQVREIGIPVRSVNWVQLFAGQTETEQDCLDATMGQESAPFFVLQIDPRDGSLRQFDAPLTKANFCPAASLAPTAVLPGSAAWTRPTCTTIRSSTRTAPSPI
ncbi:MAG TPA: hypothetical protein EYQ31_07720 [Candidatus Handelsmanbacteria bacterium]|nr:hypothetical protein [Candidatus Handelsmanbacteria bacterium]